MSLLACAGGASAQSYTPPYNPFAVEPPPPEEPESITEVEPTLDEARPFEWSWESAGGLLTGRETYQAAGGDVSFRFGTSLQLDGTAGWESNRSAFNFGKIEDQVRVRRLRLSTYGRLNWMNFKASLDLGADAGFKDLWFEGREGGLELWDYMLGKFRFGQFREPFSFERQTGNAFTSFAERSLPVQTFAPGRTLGGMVHDVSESGRAHWAVGVFSLGSRNEDDDSNSLFSITGRVTGLPIYEDDGKRLLHVGASVSNRNPTSSTRYFSRPEARYVEPYADTGNIDATGITLFGFELAGVRDSWWAQSEFISSRVNANQLGTLEFSGAYFQLGYILTGQSKRYRNNGGVFDRYRPEEESPNARFINREHAGMWEVAGRASRTDLSDGAVVGGKLTTYSAGLNYYPSWATRIQLNYIHAVPEDQGSSNIVILRVQYSPW
jgi:phosphate-selective porin OprO/OprP